MPDGAAPPEPVAHGFMTGVGHQDGRQLSGSMTTGERGHLMPICRHPITHLGPHLRRRNHVAPMGEAGSLAINAVAARSSLVTKRKRLAGTPETAAKLADGAGFWLV